MSIYLSDGNKKLKKLAGRLNKIDDTLDLASKNPVQNKTLYNPVTFAEAERQKSKNLCPVNNINASGTESVWFSEPLPIGTYTLSAIVTSNSPDSGCIVEAYSEEGWLTVFSMTKNGNRVSATREFTKPVVELRFYAGATNIWDYTATYTDVMLTTDGSTDYQQYNGAITHNSDFGIIIIRTSAENRIEATEEVIGDLYNVGNVNRLFTLNNDNVVINYDGYLEISGFIQFYIQKTATRVFFDIYLNGTQVLPQTYKDFIGRDGFTNQMPIVNHLVNVHKGDIITFRMKTDGNYGSLQVNSRIVLKGYKL